MIAELGLKVSAVFRRVVPDPFVLAVLLTGLTALLALVLGFPAEDGARPSPPARALGLLDAWRGDSGLWKFLAFGMQMCLVLVTGHALAASRPLARAIDALARRPRTAGGAAALVGLVAAATALINWGLGLIVGALLAREVGRSMRRRGAPAHYPLLGAAGYAGLLVWHGGLSGSAPLAMTTREGAAKVLPAADLERLAAEGIPLTETLFSPLNLTITLGLVVLVPLLLWRLAPRDPTRLEPYPPGDAGPAEAEGHEPTDSGEGPADRLSASRLPAWLLAGALAAAMARYAQVEGVARLGLNEVNLGMLAVGLVCHGSLASYARAVAAGARGCAGILLQFPLYAGILGMLASSGLAASFSRALASLGGAGGVPLLTWLGAAVVNFFVPSGGGQWGIQGPIALAAGLEAGLEPGRMVMAVAYGDELTNMLQPFWALPLLAITGLEARQIVGYTAILMAAAAAWMLVGLLLF